MFQNNVICDRCQKICSGSTYYTIDIYGHDINPTNDRRVSFSTAVQNTIQNTDKMFGTERHYCKDCINKIKTFLQSE